MRKPYSILYIERAEDIRGGGQLSLINILRYIVRTSFNPYLVCSSEGTLIAKVREIGIESTVIKMRPLKGLGIFSILTAILGLYRLSRRWNIKIIHSNAGATRDTFYSALTARLMGIPFIWHVRTIESGGILDRILAFLSTKIIAISNAVKQRLYWIKDSKKVEVIYNGVDLNEFRFGIDGSQIRREFNISEKDILIGTVGQLIPWKGHRYLLEAAKIVKERASNIKFLIVGDEVPEGSGYRKELEGFSLKLGLKEDVIFTGFREDIPDVMAAIDIFVLPSINEPFGRVIIEAMAMGKPVVATNSGGVPEIVVDGEIGYIVPIKDAMALAERINELINNREKREEMGRAGRKRVEEMFTIEKNVGAVERLYEDILQAQSLPK
jgi:glycosyltransferase involved in cell wall biosynthesis